MERDTLDLVRTLKARAKIPVAVKLSPFYSALPHFAAQLDRIGCFKYSPVGGAPANALADHVPPAVQEERYARFMERAAAISARRLQARVGRRLRVLVDVDYA